jgi:hypothetical protein
VKYQDSQNNAGFTVMAGAGYSILALTHHALGISVDVSPIFTKEVNVFVAQIGFMWQYH